MRILLVLFMVVTLLCGCVTIAKPEQPVVTPDDIEPNTTADEVVEAVQSEMAYSYFWIGEDIEATMAIARANEDFADFSQEQFKVLETEALMQQSYNPLITAHEAAQIAGAVFEQEYGLPQESFEPMTLAIQRVTDTGDGEWIARAELADKPYFALVELDFVTGEILSCEFSYVYHIDKEEQFNELVEGATLHEAFEVTVAGEAMIIGEWDSNHEAFNPMIDQYKEDIKTTLEGAFMLHGDSVASVELVDDVLPHSLQFNVTLSNDRMIVVSIPNAIMMYTDIDTEGYPLRHFSMNTPEKMPDPDYSHYAS